MSWGLTHRISLRQSSLRQPWGVPHPSAFVAEEWEAKTSRGPQGLASIYSLVHSISQVLPNSNGYIPQKMRFRVRSMKTKGLFSRYPRKISLLKDLQRGIPGAFQLCKLLKTDGGLEIPSKISLLKDLADAFLGKFSVFGPYSWSVSIVKELELLIAVYRTANVVSHMLSE